MIANVDIKSCPFRKETILVSSEARSQYQDIGTCYQENFLECIEEKCMGWDKKEHICLLMRKEDK